MLGFSIGPLFGGLLTHTASWRVIFWLNIPLMCVAIAGLAAARAAPAHRDRAPHPTIDWLGFILLATAMVSTILALQALPQVCVGAADRHRSFCVGRRGIRCAADRRAADRSSAHRPELFCPAQLCSSACPSRRSRCSAS